MIDKTRKELDELRELDKDTKDLQELRGQKSTKDAPASDVEAIVNSKFGGDVLRLNIKKAPFEVMASGEKDIEVREKSDWINSRLFNNDGSKRDYDYIEFTNGYGKDKPKFICEYKGFDNCNGMNWTYSNGFNLLFNGDRWIIYLGKVVAKFNC